MKVISQFKDGGPVRAVLASRLKTHLLAVAAATTVLFSAKPRRRERTGALRSKSSVSGAVWP